MKKVFSKSTNGKQSSAFAGAAVQVLLAVETGADALKALYHFKKAENPRFSLAMLCKQTGIPSRGYLSSVMSGRRVLNAKYIVPVVKALQLSELSERYFEKLLLRDAEAIKAKAEWDAELSELRRALEISERSFPRSIESNFFSFEVFAAFSLFENKPNLSQLKSYFSDKDEAELKAALLHLIDWNIIQAIDDCYEPIDNFVLFSNGTGHFSHIDFLRYNLRQAERRVHRWFAQRDYAVFQSSLLSVKKSELPALLNAMRADLTQMQSRLEMQESDEVLCFNVQIYPLRESGPF